MAKKKVLKKVKKQTALKKTSGKVKKKVMKKVAAKKKMKVGGRKKVLAVPKGYHALTPYLVVNQAADAIEFYKKAFGAKVAFRMDQPDGKVSHAELKIGDSKLMLADECPEMKARSPEAFGGSPVIVHFYTKNVDKTVEQAVALGATLKRPVEDMFYGDRAGTLEDPFGHTWHVSTHIEDVTPAKMRKRVAELFGQ